MRNRSSPLASRGVRESVRGPRSRTPSFYEDDPGPPRSRAEKEERELKRRYFRETDGETLHSIRGVHPSTAGWQHLTGALIVTIKGDGLGVRTEEEAQFHHAKP